MNDFKCYLNDADRKRLFDIILKMNGNIIPDQLYPVPTYSVITNSEQFIDYINKNTTQFFVISDESHVFPIILKQNRFIDKPAYSFMQRVGGPYITISFSRGFAENATIPFK